MTAFVAFSVLISIITTFSTVEPVEAAVTFQVGSTADLTDSNPGDGNCATSSGACTLRAAIQEANATAAPDVINLPAGTYTLSIPGTEDSLAESGDLDITAPLTIIGDSATAVVVDGGAPPAGAPVEQLALDRLFDIHASAASVFFSDLTIQGGYHAEAGGAVFNTSPGTVRFERVTVRDSFATNFGGGIYSGAPVDCIEPCVMTVGRLELVDSEVSGNGTEGEGGGIAIEVGSLTISGGAVSANHARHGAGIWSAGELSETGLPTAITVTDATISDNTSAASGAGIFVDHQGSLNLVNATISGNETFDGGGGVHAASQTEVTITGGTISNNRSVGEGAGVFVATEAGVAIDGTIFSGNEAGASMTNEIGELVEGDGGGGGIMAGGSGTVRILNSDFDGNSAVGEGGGILIENNGSVEITDSIVRNNLTATNGGGIENHGMTVTFRRLQVEGNRAILDGGGIESQGSGAFTILDTDIIGNTAENGGGFANAADGTLRIVRTTFFDNRAVTGLNDDTGLGGGIYSLGDAGAEYENVTISGNLAQVRGGGFYVDADAGVRVVSSTISRNSAPLASGVGGEIGSINFPVMPSTSVIFRNTIVAGNLLGPACTFAIGSEGGNYEDGDTCLFRGTKDRANAPDPMLDAVADNGGHTMTMALHPDSLAVDGGVNPCPATDQRGVVRPQNSICDSGAYESVGPFPPVDNIAPIAEILSTGPVQDTENTSVFFFTGTDIDGSGNAAPPEHLLFECRLIEGDPTEPPEPPDPTAPPAPELAFLGCASPWQVKIIEDGTFTLEVRAIDRAGNVGEADVLTFQGVVDLVPPQTFILEAPEDQDLTTAGVQNYSNSSTFTFGATDDHTPIQFIEFECRIDTTDPNAWLECTNPTVFSNLSVGTHTVQARAADGGDNVDPTPAAFTWQVLPPIDCDSANITLNPIADTWVDQLTPGDQMSSVFESMVVRSAPLAGNARALVQFAVSNDSPSCVLESATLRLYASSSSESRTLVAVPLAGPWAENTATWNDQPAITGTPSMTSSGDGYRVWDVTDDVQAMLAGTLSNYGWSIRDLLENDSDGAEQTFHTRQTPQDPPPVTLPQLVLRFVPTGAPAPAAPVGTDDLTKVDCDPLVPTPYVVLESIKLDPASNLAGCMGEVLVIGAHNIVVDLNGVTITSGMLLEPGEEDGLIAAIRNAGWDNVVIKNGTVKNYGYGVRLMGSTIYNVVENMTFDGNVIAGVELFDADNGRNGNTIRNNTFLANGEGAVALTSGSEGSIVEGNTFIGNGGVAIRLQDANDNIIRNNTISGLILDPLIDSDGGLFLVGASDNEILNNVVGDAGDAGISLSDGSHRNIIRGNQVFRNSDAGISINDSDGNIVDDNEVYASGGAGIGLGNAHGGELTNNDVRFNPGGIELGGSNDNLIRGNDVSFSRADGIVIEGGLLNELNLNTANHTRGTGISVEAEAVDLLGNPIPGNRIIDNEATGNLGDGISVSAGGHIVSDNDAYNNAGFGITAGEFVTDNGLRNRASGNGEPEQCVGVVCDTGTAPPTVPPDLTPPDTVILTAPVDGASSLAPQTFTFEGSDNTAPGSALHFECRLDAPPDPEPEPQDPPDPNEPPEPVEPPAVENWLDCGSPQIYNLVAPGEHTFEVRAIDPFDNIDLTPAQHIWVTVAAPPGPDAIVPTVTVTAGPELETSSTTATLTFRGSDNVTPGHQLEYQCRLTPDETVVFTDCASPVEYTELVIGTIYLFEVQAIDLAGNVSVVASHTWEVVAPPEDETAPETTINSGPDLTTVLTSASFTFSSNETGTFECSLDGEPFVTCTSPVNYSGLSIDEHTFAVQADDGVNVDPTPAEYEWEVVPAPVAAVVSCGQVLTQSTVVQNDLFDCLGDGLVIGADKITVDLNGHMIDGTGLGSGVVNNGHDSVTITNGTIQGFEFGVLLNPGTSLNIVSTVSAELNELAGIQLSNADSGGLGNIVRNNTLGANGAGIALTNGTQNTRVTDNTVGGSSGFGIYLFNASGNHLEGNLVSATSDGGVVLEGSRANTIVGNTVSGAADAGLVISLVSHDNVIEANTITGSEAGIVVLDSDRNLVVGNLATGSGDSGVSLENANDGVVRDNDLRLNSGGIEISGSSRNLIESNDLSQSSGPGIEVGDLSLENVIVNNVASGNDGEGIHVGDDAPPGSGNLIQGNVTETNSTDGIYVGGVGHIIVDNTANNNGGWGIYSALGTVAGINIDGGGNTATGNVGGGLDPFTLEVIQCFNIKCDGGAAPPSDLVAPQTSILEGPSDPTYFDTATFTFTGSDNATGVTFECRLDSTLEEAFLPCGSPQGYSGLGAAPHTFEVRAVDFLGNVDATPAVYTWTVEAVPDGTVPETMIDSGPDLTTVSNSATFNFSSNLPGVTFECALDGAPFELCTSPATYDGLTVDSHTFSVRAVHGVDVDPSPPSYAWTVADAPVTANVVCGQTISVSTLVGNDLLDCPGNGLVVGASGITIDLNGHTIDGLGLGAGILNDGFDSVTVTNGTVQEFDFGVQLNVGSDHNIISGLVLSLNQNAGIALTDASGAIVRTNEVTGNLHGIWLTAGSDGALITDNTVDLSSGDGIRLEGSGGATLDQNRVSGSSAAGVALVGSSNNTLTANVLAFNAGGGLMIGETTLPANDNVVVGNVLSNNSAGITLTESSGNNLVGNTLQSNDSGISVELSTGTVIRGNDVRGNSSGIELSDSSGNTIDANIVTGNDGAGISVAGLSLGNSITANMASANSEGISVEAVGNGIVNTISGNTASSNSGDGIFVAGGGHVVSDNEANFNAGWGIFAEPTPVDVGGNEALGNVEVLQCSGIACVIGVAPGAPDTTIIDKPTNPTSSRNALFTFVGTDNTTALIDLGFECRLDSVDVLDWIECDNPLEYFELDPGTHFFEVRAVDLEGNVDPSPASYEWTYEALPTGVAPDTFIDMAPVDSPLLEGIFTFSADEPDVTFECSLDGADFELCEFVFEYGFAETEVGPHTFSVRATDFEGNTDPTPATHNWTVLGVLAVITDGPAFVPGDGEEPASGGETDSRQAHFVFHVQPDVDASFECSVDFLPFEPCTSPVTYGDSEPLTDGPLVPGEHSFQVIVSQADPDNPGELLFIQIEPTVYEWIVLLAPDVTPPETTIDSAPESGTSDTVFTFSGTDNQSQPLALTFECRLDSTDEAAWVECVSPFNLLVEFPEFAPGVHTMEVRANDNAELVDPPAGFEGNIDPTPAVHTWTSVADLIEPQTVFSGPLPQAVTDQTDATFSFTGTDNATPELQLIFECSIDSGTTWEECSSPETVSVLPGLANFQVRAVDLALNVDTTPATYSWTVVNTPVGSGVDIEVPMAGGLLATFNFATVTAFGETTVTLLGTGEALPEGYEAGALFFEISTTATYTGPIEICLSYDPNGFAEPTAVRLLHYEGGVAEDVTTSNDPEGTVCGEVSSLSPFAIAEGVDNIGPVTTITSGPTGTVNSSTAVFTFQSSAAQATFECTLNGDAFVPCESPHELTGLTDALYTLAVRSVDLSLNTGAAVTRAWTVDGPPVSTVMTGPDEETESTTATFEFTANQAATFECWLDGVITAGCESPKTYSGLTVGDHLFAVRATDPGGNVEPLWVEHEWTVIPSVAPNTSFAAGGTPAGTTSATTATFSFTGSDNLTDPADLGFECSLDGAGFSSCTSPLELTGLAEAPHTLSVRAIDQAGTIDPTPATYNWTVVAPDVTDPETTIDGMPATTTTDSSASFAFSSNEIGSTFECSVDGGAFASCTSPKTITGLTVGDHSFAVRAIDASGNTDESDEVFTWTVEPPPPDCGSQFTVTASADAWIDEGSSSNNGTDSTLKVMSKSGNSDLRALVRFNLPAMPAGCAIDTATLTLNASGASSGRTLQAIRITGNWTEGGVTWGNQPATTGTAATTSSGTGVRSWNVATQVQAMYTAGNFNGFLIRDASENQDAEQQFNSREHSQNRPSLTVRFKPADSIRPVTAPPVLSVASPSSTSATLTLGGTDNVTPSSNLTFKCRLDGAAFAACTSPVNYSGLTVGPHTFEAVAADEAGNEDLTPESIQWTVEAPPPDTVAPNTTISSGPSATTTATTASFTFAADETSTFACTLDSGAPTACTSPSSVSGLSVGPHTFSVLATDTATNVELAAATYTWEVQAPSCTQTTVTVNAAADSWVLQDAASSNYGSDSNLKVEGKSGANARSLVRFNLPTIPQGCQLQSATLRLFASGYKTGRTLDAYALAGSWTEPGVNWSNQPASAGTAASTSSGSNWRQWNVTSQVTGMYAPGGVNNGFMVRDRNNGNNSDQQFNSRESGNNRPQLVLVFG